MEFVENFGYFVAFIGSLVFFHELGHFLVAKACDVKVVSFSLGFGPELFSFVHGETRYRIAVLPLGGYVKMTGELPGMEIPDEDWDRALTSKPLWQRSAVVLAGPLANFFLALCVYFFMFTGPHAFNDTRVGIVSQGAPAWQAGIRPGDKILTINGEAVERWEDMLVSIGERPAEHIDLTYERAGQIVSTRILTESRNEQNIFQEQERRGKIGVSLFYVKPTVAVVDSQSPAALAGLLTGDVITKVGERDIAAWHEVRQALATWPAETALSLTVKRDEQTLTFSLLADERPEGVPEQIFSSADLPSGYTGLVSGDVIVDRVDEGTPAAEAGLVKGDRLLVLSMRDEAGTFTEKRIGVWGTDLASFQGADARNGFTLTVQRGREIFSTSLKLMAKEETDDFNNVTTRYVFGAFNDRSLVAPYQYERDVGASEALMASCRQVGADMTLIGKGIYKIFEGVVPLDSMGGPIMLFVIAEKSARRGIDHFLRMLAIISVNLGLLNLLPIPVLDGGHLLMFAIEGIRRRPPSMRIREITNMIGMVILLLLMVLVFSNDIMRFIIG